MGIVKPMRPDLGFLCFPAPVKCQTVDFLIGIVKPMRPDFGFLCCVQCQVSKYQKPDARIRVAHYQSVYDLLMYVIFLLKKIVSM